MNIRRASQTVLSAVLAFVAVCRAVAMAEPTAADAPQVPGLIVGAEPPAPQSFVIDGFVRSSGDKGIGFHVATDGKRQVCALYDAADGAPMFFSDGQQTLIYDLAENRILWVTPCRGNVRIDWETGAAKPLNFSFNFDYQSDPEKLAANNAWFRLDRFVAASGAALKRVEAPAGTAIWAAERADGSAIESVQMKPADPSWFSFRSLVKGKDYYALEVHATSINRPAPAAALAFPNVAKLAKAVPVEEFNLKTKPALMETLSSGRCFAPKFALAGQDADKSLKKLLPHVPPAALREQDARFSARYRAALAAQGIKFATLKSAKPSTRPARSKADLIEKSD